MSAPPSSLTPPPTPQRWKLTLEYDGRPFCGWQRQDQPGRMAVQEVLEAALYRLTDETPRLHVAGRTDAGVHASGQVAHVDLLKPLGAHTIRNALNALVRPLPVAVIEAEPVPSSFEARFGAIGRAYRYRILNRRAPPVLEAGLVWHEPRRLDTDAMAEGARRLLGRHDFSTFRAAFCQANSPIRTLDRLDVTRSGDLITLEVAARSFLHHQVRNMVGTLALLGLGRWSADDLTAALEARDRRRGGPTAPPQGLCLTQVRYPAITSSGDTGVAAENDQLEELTEAG